MSVVAEKNEVSVVDGVGEGGTGFKVIFRGRDVLLTSDRAAAMDAFGVLQPKKATCSKCGQMDIIVFKGRVGAGRFRIQGDGGWITERVFGGLTEYRDVTLCPECVVKEDQRYAEYLARKKK